MKSAQYYGIGNNEYNYYKTFDNGKTWKIWKPGEGKAVFIEPNKIVTDGLKESKDNLETLENLEIKGEIIDDHHVKTPDGYYETEDWETFTPIKPPIDLPQETDLLLHILNDILIPDMAFMLTNHSELKQLKYGDFINGESFFTNKELYKGNAEGIDYAIDVGMRPLTDEEFKEYQEFKNAQAEIDEEFKEDDLKDFQIDKELRINDKLRTTFNIIDLKLNNYKELIQKKEFEITNGLEENYEGLKPEEIPIMKMYYDIRKGVEESINGTIINSIFTFNNSKKMALLKSSIIDAINDSKDSINLDINLLYKKILSGTFNKETDETLRKIFAYDLTGMWIKGLNHAIKDYYKISCTNIFALSENEDKEYIHIAAEKYKNVRSDLIELVRTNIKDMKEKDCSKMLNVEKYLTDSSKALDNYVIQVKEAATEEEVNKIFDDYVKEEENRLKEITTIYEGFSKYFIKDVEELFNNGLMDEILNNYNFTEDEYEEELSNVPQESINKVYNYYNNILNKFKERCIKVAEITGKEMTNYFVNNIFKDSLSLNIWTNNMLLSNDKEKYILDNSIDYLKKEKEEACKDYYHTSKSMWIDARNLI